MTYNDVVIVDVEDNTQRTWIIEALNEIQQTVEGQALFQAILDNPH